MLQRICLNTEFFIAVRSQRSENMSLLVINSVLLLSANIFFGVLAARNINLSALTSRIGTWLKGEQNKGKLLYTDTQNTDVDARLTIFERLELTYIVKSNIRRYIPFMNIYILIGIGVLIFAGAYGPVSKMLKFMPSSLIISGIISIIPFFALDLMARYNSEAVRKMLSEFISVLSRWCSVKEDIMYAFEKSLDSHIGEPLQTFVKDMVIQVNRGIDSSDALDMLQKKVDSPHFVDFIVNVKQCLKNRGDTIKLLTNLENQFYRIDEEYNRRKISTYKDRMLLYIIMFSVLLIAYMFISFTPQIKSFYLETLEGKLLLTLFSGMYALGFYLTAGIMKFK